MATSGPSESTLRRWVVTSLALTTRAVAALGDDGPDVPAPRLDRVKVVGEALLLLRATSAATTGHDDLAAAWRRLYDVTAPLARPETLAVALCVDPSHALEHAFSHVQLSALGDEDPPLDALLDQALAEAACGPEPNVVAALHRAWLHALHDGTPAPAAMRPLLERSSLGRPVDVLRCSTEDVYDLTHAVMHATDLGRWPVVLPRPARDLSSDLDALLGVALDAGTEGNLDLTAELLWSWPMLGLPWTPTAGFAWHVLARSVDRWGFLPGPGFEPALHDGLSPAEAGAYVLRTSYHATLVAGIFGAAALAAPPLPQASTEPTPGAGARVLGVLDVDPPRTWRRLVIDAGPDDVAATLLTIALRRCSDAFDLPMVRDLLRLALELDLAQGQTVRQAVSLLRRGSALASLSELTAPG